MAQEIEVKLPGAEWIQTLDEYVADENPAAGVSVAPMTVGPDIAEYEMEDDDVYPTDDYGAELPMPAPGNVENKVKKNAKFQMLADSVMFQANEPAVEDSPPFWFSMNLKGQDEFLVTASKTSVISREDAKLLRKAIKKVLVAEKEQFGTIDDPKEATATLTVDNEQPNAAMLEALAPVIEVLDGNKVNKKKFLSTIQESITAFLNTEEDTAEGGNPAS